LSFFNTCFFLGGIGAQFGWWGSSSLDIPPVFVGVGFCPLPKTWGVGPPSGVFVFNFHISIGPLLSVCVEKVWSPTALFFCVGVPITMRHHLVVVLVVFSNVFGSHVGFWLPHQAWGSPNNPAFFVCPQKAVGGHVGLGQTSGPPSGLLPHRLGSDFFCSCGLGGTITKKKFPTKNCLFL